MYTKNKRLEREIKDTIPFIIVPKRIKCPGINLPKKKRNIYSENCKALKKETNMTETDGKVQYILVLEESILSK